jgi:alanine racemase
MSRPTFLQINLAALRHNLTCVRKSAPHSQVMVMIKANGYGHGLVETAHALIDSDAFGVAFLEEALVLRAAGIKKPIVLMEGFFDVTELQEIAQHDLEIVVHQYEQLEILERETLAKPIMVWLKINTGLHRLGFAPQEAHNAWQRLSQCANVKEQPRVLSHFSEPDNLLQPTTRDQFTLFNQSIAGLSVMRSLANSAGVLAWPDMHCEWVRPGIMLYGVSPFMDKTGLDHGLKPVMTLCSKLMAVYPVRKGQGIGYGRTFICQEDMMIGIVAIGYGDGYPRHAKNGTPVLVNNKIVPLVGRVSMDMIAVDLCSQPNAKIGDPVVLWGEGLPVEKVASSADTIAYELLCHVTSRVRRIYL